MEKKHILCFGDSLTWGYDPVNKVRFAESSRWPMVMQSALGEGYAVIEEGQNGRTIATDDPAEGEKNGLKYIGPCLESHSPLDWVIVMLGVNDCKRKFSYSAMDVAGEMQIFLEKILSYRMFRCQDQFQVLLVAPPAVSPAIRDSWLGDSFGYEQAQKVSEELPAWYRQLADTYGCCFFNAADHVKVSDADGVHLDAEDQIKLGRLLAETVASYDLQSSGEK